jgi:hypothetical protein
VSVSLHAEVGRLARFYSIPTFSGQSGYEESFDITINYIMLIITAHIRIKDCDRG